MVNTWVLKTHGINSLAVRVCSPAPKIFMKLKQVTIPLYMVYDKDGHPILVDNLAKYDNEEVDIVTEDDWDDEGNNCGVSYGYLK